jgi:AcrR family transcriptional regulator
VDGPQASLDEVARRADVGDATLYHHFGDRDDLIRQVATHVIVQVAGDAESALAGKDAPFQALRRCLPRTGAVPQVMRGAVGPRPRAERTARLVPRVNRSTVHLCCPCTSALTEATKYR